MSYNTFTLTGTYKNPGGVADKGGVVVVPSVSPLVDNVGNVILAGAVSAELDSNGSFSLVLPTTGANLLPASFGYTLIVHLNGAGRQGDVTFTPPANGTTLNVAQITPAPLPAVVTPTAVTQAGLDGSVAALVNDGASGAGVALVAKFARKDSALYNVKGYGAVGDGTTDDTAAIQSALTAAGASTTPGNIGATVLLPPGTYKVTGLTVPAEVVLTGTGLRGSRIKALGAVTAVTMNTRSSLINVGLIGDSTAGGIGVSFAATSSHSTLSDVFISAFDKGVYVENTYINALTRVTIQSCTTGLHCHGSQVNALYMTGGEIQGCTTGVSCTTTTSTDVVFHGVTIEGNSGVGIAHAGSTWGWTIRDCYFEANTTGHIYGSTSQSRALVIDGNTFAGTAGYCVKLDFGVDTLIQGNLFNGGTLAIQCAAAVARTTVARNYYLPGIEFVRATHYLGTGLVEMDRETALPASTTTAAGLNIPHGTAPTTPKDGDTWTTTAGLFVRANGKTYGPVGARYLVGSAVPDPASIAAGAQATFTITVTGALVGDDATAHPNSMPETGLVWNAVVTATDTVTVRLSNISTGPVDPVARTWRAIVWGH